MNKVSKKNGYARRPSNVRQRGSALVAAMIFAVVVGISAASYLKLANSEYRFSVRSTLYASSLNLAESGIEMGVEAVTSGIIDGSSWKKTVSGYLQDGSFTGDVTVVVLDADKSNPVVYAEGVVKGHPTGNVKKQVRVELTSGFNPYANGFSARNGIRLTGNNVLLDSYNSNYGPYDAILPPFYTDASGNTKTVPNGYGVSGYNKNDDIFVSSDSVNSEGLTIIDQGNADIYGYVTVKPGSQVSIGPNGVVSAYDNGSHDTTRVLSNFYADFPEPPHPTGTFDSTYSNISGLTLINGSSDSEAPKFFDVSSVSLSGRGSLLVISGHVALVMSGDIKVSGKGGIYIASNSTLKIYTADDVNIAGNGVANADAIPSNFELYGTSPTLLDADGDLIAGQTIKISGNGQLASAVYAPAADVTLNGGGNNGEVLGGVVAFTASVAGNSSFHFDEALRDNIMGGGVYSIQSWMEMTGATTATKPLELSTYTTTVAEISN